MSASAMRTGALIRPRERVAGRRSHLILALLAIIVALCVAMPALAQNFPAPSQPAVQGLSLVSTPNFSTG